VNATDPPSIVTPLVLLHDIGAGTALWLLNIDALAAHRPVYIIDMLGFGKSSRPTFSDDAVLAEMEMVEALEAWRIEVRLEKFILVGHGFGGFIATSYTIRYIHFNVTLAIIIINIINV